MENTLQDFFRCIDEVALAERRRDFQGMRHWLDRASKLPVVNQLQKWVLDYTETIAKLLYEHKADRNALCQELYVLRNQVYKDGSPSYSLVKELYIRLLVQLLQKQYQNMEQFPHYEEITVELLQRMEDERRYELDGEDLYAFAYSVAGTYFRRQGEILKSEKYFVRVWEKVQRETNVSIYAFCAIVELMKNLLFQGKTEQACEVGTFLKQKLSNGEVQGTFQPDIQRYAATFCMVLEGMGQRKQALVFLQESLDSGLIQETYISDELVTVYALLLGEYLFQEYSPPGGLLKKVRRCFHLYRMNTDFSGLTPWRRCNYCLARFYLDCLNKSMHHTKYLDKCAEILKCEDFPEVDRMSYLTAMLHVIRNYCVIGMDHKAAKCVDHLMHRLLQYAARTEYYAENVLLERYMGICKLSFHMAYMATAKCTSTRKRMEYSLNGKHLLSSALYLRNRMNEKFEKKAERPALPWYSLNQLVNTLPEGTAVIDMIYSEPEVWQTGQLWSDDEKHERILELFLVARVQTEEVFRYKCIEHAEEWDQKILLFCEKLKTGEGKLKRLSREIYACFKDILEELSEQVGSLWICPDRILCNLPFETLFQIACPEQNKWEIVYWKSLRDMFRIWKEGKEMENAGIICPDFGLTGEKAWEYTELDAEHAMNPLPFSVYEAKKVAKRLDGRCYIGKEATAGKVQPGYRYLHISTHGIQVNSVGNAWYESGLAFSIQSDSEDRSEPVKHNHSDPQNDRNGILMAEQISRMDLSGTELVTLSACYAGYSRYSGLQEPNGVHIAFGIAGVRYVVSALWQMDDLAAALFMVFFYSQIADGTTVPAALRFAAMKLRETTAGEVIRMLEQENGWTHKELGDAVEKLREIPEDYRLYQNSRYWGGIICYQNRR